VNFLSHLFLAGTDPLFRTGSLMGDFLRGVDRQQLPPAIESGIVHHLAVDSFTDSHPAVKELRALFSPPRRRYAGIILDVTFDHLLLKHWEQFSHESPADYIRRTNRTLLDNRSAMPPRMRQIVSLLVQHDVLLSYRSLHGVQTALDRISDRFSRTTPLAGSTREVRDNIVQIDRGFLAFFPELLHRFGNGSLPDQQI